MAKISTFKTSVTGVRYRQDAVAQCREGQKTGLIRDPDNRHDKNAIIVYANATIGFIKRDEARNLAPFMDGGGKAEACISELTGGTLDKSTIGVILQITKTPASLMKKTQVGAYRRKPWVRS